MEAFNPSSIPSLPFSYTFTTTTAAVAAATTATATSTPYMDSRIWSKLPQRLLDRIIAFLPPPAFFRARAVCKRFYTLLYTTGFLQLSMQLSPRHHWFVFFKHKTLKSTICKTTLHHNNNNRNAPAATNAGTATTTLHEGYLFDPYEISWYRISFGLIPSGFSPASSSGGLILWVSDEAGSKVLILSNPLTGSLTHLPPTLRPRLFPSVGLNVSLSSIDVSVAGDDLISPYAVKNLSTESFHIDAGGFYSLWGTTCSLPRLCNLESGRMVQVNGKYYCMNYSPFSVLSYDIVLNTWSTIQAPMRRFLRSPTLIETKGRLILVAAVEKSKLNVPRSLRLWSLQSGGTPSWVEIERMPQQLYFQFDEIEANNGFDCVGHGEFIVIMIKGSSNKGLLFDICRKRWQWIPPCPYVYGGGGGSGDDGGRELYGFAYEPRLATPVTGLLDQLTVPFQPFVNG